MATDRSLDLVCDLKKVGPSVKVIAFAVEDQDSEIIACAEAGVDGYVTPEGSMDDLTETILSVTRGELLCSPRIAATLYGVSVRSRRTFANRTHSVVSPPASTRSLG
jgi:DNA-binding NarL/FixJ family response regulator